MESVYRSRLEIDEMENLTWRKADASRFAFGWRGASRAAAFAAGPGSSPDKLAADLASYTFRGLAALF